MVDGVDCFAHFAGQLEIGAVDIGFQLSEGRGTDEIACDMNSLIDPGEAHLREIETGFSRDAGILFDRGVAVRTVVTGKSLPLCETCSLRKLTSPIRNY